MAGEQSPPLRPAVRGGGVLSLPFGGLPSSSLARRAELTEDPSLQSAANSRNWDPANPPSDKPCQETAAKEPREILPLRRHPHSEGSGRKTSLARPATGPRRTVTGARGPGRQALVEGAVGAPGPGLLLLLGCPVEGGPCPAGSRHLAQHPPQTPTGRGPCRGAAATEGTRSCPWEKLQLLQQKMRPQRRPEKRGLFFLQALWTA